MKKLLTIVLCVAVVFTFSFSGAFAAKSDVNDKLAEQYLEDALDAVDGSADSTAEDGYRPDGIWVTDLAGVPAAVATDPTEEDEYTNCYLNVTYDVLVANKADLLEAAKEWAADDANTGKYIGQKAADGTIKSGQAITDLIIWTADSANTNKTSYEDLCQSLASAQFAVDKADALAILDGISFSSVSTKEMKKDCAHTSPCETYKEHVQKLVEDARKFIDDLENNSDTGIYSNNNRYEYTTLITNEDEINSIIGKVSSLENKTKSADADKWTDESGASARKNIWLVVQKAYKSGDKWEGLSSYELNEDWKEVPTADLCQIYYSYSSTELNSYYSEDDSACKTIGDYLTENKDADEAVADANITSLKAQVTAQKAKYLKKNTSTSQKEYADNMQAALNYLIEQEVITASTDADKAAFATELESLLPASKETSENGSEKYGTNAKAATKYAKELTDEAATLAAETDENGTLIRDKKDVDDLLEAGLISMYLLGKGETEAYYDGNAKKGDYTSISSVKAAAKSDIESLYVSLDDTKLEYYKKNTISIYTRLYEEAADDNYDLGIIDGDSRLPASSYAVSSYTPERTKFKEALDKMTASIEAATKYQQVDKAVETFENDYYFTENSKWYIAYNNHDAINALASDAVEYADILNSKIKKSDDKYVAGAYYGDTDDYTGSPYKLYTLICDLVGEKNARTTAEINKLSDEALALVKTLPTQKQVDDAKEALDDAMKALPSTIKLADADKIDAACAAYEAYKELTEDRQYQKSDLEDKIEALTYAKNNELEDKYDKLDKTDKAALDALQDEIDAFVEKYGEHVGYIGRGIISEASNDVDEDEDDDVPYAYSFDTQGKYQLRSIITVDEDITSDLAKIRQDDLDDVKAAINKIPAKANITEESKPVIQAARKAYDAYVEKWTAYENQDFTWTRNYAKNGAYAADDLGSYYKTLTAAEAAAGLNTTSAADLVKEFKIVAKSTAKKGSITVTWKVVSGDESAADGYQIWKSTKHSKGYKKVFTTTKKSYKNTKGLKKGTRYYYKVRAYVKVDGKNVYSDWSNKARRVAR